MSRRSPWRICFIDHTVKMGGGQLYLLTQIDALDRSCFEPLVVCPMEGALTDELRARKVAVKIVPVHPALIGVRKEEVAGSVPALFLNPWRFLAAVLRVRRLLRVEQIDLIHLNSMKAAFYGGMAGWLARIPVVWDLKDIISTDFFHPLNQHLIVFFANRFASRVVANSQVIRAEFICQGGRIDKVVAIHNGIDLDRFQPEYDSFDLRAELGLQSDSLVVSNFSRLDRWKGHDCFLKAAAQVVRQYPKTRFLVVGDVTFDEPGYKKELLHLTHKLGLEETVFYLGFRHDVADLMALSDVVVHSSVLPEPLGLTVIEAQAAGRPVVATKAGGPLETVADGETGLLVEPNDPKAMAEAIQTLLGNPDLRIKMGQAGRRRAETMFDLKTNTGKVQEVYLSLLRK